MLFRIDTDNPGLMRSQLKALSRQIPLLYLIVLVNTVAVAYTHYGVAPEILKLRFPRSSPSSCSRAPTHG